MMTRYRAALDGRQLDAVAAGIIIKDIAYSAPAMQYTASTLSGRSGQYIQGHTYGTAGVVITLEIHEAAINVRQDVCRKIQQWAMHGGVMTTNDRPGQRMSVRCSALPEIESVKRWTGDIQIVFTAYEKPYWEDIAPTVARDVSVGISKALYVGGTIDDTQVDVTVRNDGDTVIDSLVVSAGESFMAFEGLALYSGGTLEIGHDASGLLYIKADGESRMDKRTAESSDDLVIEIGKKSTVSISAEGAANAVFVTRGRYA